MGSLPQSTKKMEPSTRNGRKPRCRYCGELSAYPWGAQQICLRCEKIRERAETFLRGDDEILLYVQDRLRRNEKADERAEQAERRAARRKALDKRMGRSDTLVVDRPKRGQIYKLSQMFADPSDALSIPQSAQRPHVAA
jgi:hypothetical protein